MRFLLTAVAAAALLAACASSRGGPGPVRFANQPPVWRVNDRLPGEQPASDEKGLVQYYVEQDYVRPIERALTIEPGRRATNVNCLDELPDSTWFTNRIGRREITPEMIRRGPTTQLPRPPFAVSGVKVGGAAIGLQASDATGRKFIIKFDEAEFPETESATDVVVQRVMWAAGYNVPDNNIVEFERRELVLADDAELEDLAGNARPMTEKDLDHYLSIVSTGSHFRALASRLVDGEVIGGIRPEGVRPGDRNDLVPHELRRDLRGQRMFWAWVNNADIKPHNTLAVYTDGGYMVRYHIDFGKAMGQWARINGRVYTGYKKDTNLRTSLLSAISFGLWVPPWERQIDYPDYRGIGYFSDAYFEPVAWTAAHNWRPMDLADRFDEYWAAKIIARFRREHIEAAVEAARYSDPRAARYVVDVLERRRDKILAYAFSRVAPLEDFTVRSNTDSSKTIEVCFRDLGGPPERAAYRATVFDFAGERLLERAAIGEATGSGACFRHLPTGSDRDGYTIVAIQVRRGDHGPRRGDVHLARRDGNFEVIGVDRR